MPASCYVFYLPRLPGYKVTCITYLYTVPIVCSIWSIPAVGILVIFGTVVTTSKEETLLLLFLFIFLQAGLLGKSAAAWELGVQFIFFCIYACFDLAVRPTNKYDFVYMMWC